MAPRRSKGRRNCGPEPGSTPDRPERQDTRQPVAHSLRWARTAYEYFWLCLGYVYFGGLGMLVTLVSAVLYPLLPRQVGSHLARSVIGMLFRSFLALLRTAGLLRVDLSALDALR